MSEPVPFTSEQLRELRALLLSVRGFQDACVGALSPVQNDVYRALGCGLTCREISVERNCSVKTIDTHRHAVLERLQLDSTVQIARLKLARDIADALGLDLDLNFEPSP